MTSKEDCFAGFVNWMKSFIGSNSNVNLALETALKNPVFQSKWTTNALEKLFFGCHRLHPCFLMEYSEAEALLISKTKSDSKDNKDNKDNQYTSSTDPFADIPISPAAKLAASLVAVQDATTASLIFQCLVDAGISTALVVEIFYTAATFFLYIWRRFKLGMSQHQAIISAVECFESRGVVEIGKTSE